MAKKARKASPAEITRRAKKIRLLLLDVDGVLTDGTLLYDGEGRECKSFHVWDGLAIRLLKEYAGIPTAIISGRGSKAVEVRALDLGIEDLHLKIKNKAQALNQLIAKHSLRDEEICGVGDDIVDLPFLLRVGLPVATANAHEDAKAQALYVTKTPGGSGAVREVVELLLRARGEWEKVLAHYRGLS